MTVDTYNQRLPLTSFYGAILYTLDIYDVTQVSAAHACAVLKGRAWHLVARARRVSDQTRAGVSFPASRYSQSHISWIIDNPRRPLQFYRRYREKGSLFVVLRYRGAVMPRYIQEVTRGRNSFS